MDVQHLALLRELAERGSVTEVARATHRSPSAVSQQLKTLQRQVGAELVRRVGRGVELTDAGRALAASSIKVATAIAEAEATWEAFRHGTTGQVTIALFPSAAELLLPGLLHRLAAHPGIEVEIIDSDVSEDEFGALAADADVVVGHRSDGLAPPDRASLSVIALLREPLDIALPLGHPLAGGESVTLDDVIGEPWVGVPAGYPIDRVLMSMALQSGVAPRIVHRSIHLPLLENLVAAGHGIALLPRYTSGARASGRLHLARLENIRAGRQIEALMRPDRAARGAVRVVVDELRAEAAAVTA
ncbi:LysR family transcriptional regulator [Frigoribacterium sp. 2-23]|uniref:LysR family transcriptional regulator n=1 Tax=Frigoribacterium sp. 2-23 TaxID=3415006 RepID=UPI003C6EBC29